MKGWKNGSGLKAKRAIVLAGTEHEETEITEMPGADLGNVNNLWISFNNQGLARSRWVASWFRDENIGVFAERMLRSVTTPSSNPGQAMKTNKSNHKQNGKPSAYALLEKAAAAKRLAKGARKHLKMIKAEHKQARKAFKQARKAAKRANKEAKVAAKMLKADSKKNLTAVRARADRGLNVLAHKRAVSQRSAPAIRATQPGIVSAVQPATGPA